MNKDMTPKVSVITPVYKAERFIKRCVHSALSQTLQSFEMLLVDDGSPDKSGAICDALALTDGRIKVFHKENGGASSARNLALDNAKGEYIVLLDSDDWLDFGCLETCTRIADENHLDFIDFGHRHIDDFGMFLSQTKINETPVLNLKDFVGNGLSTPKGCGGSFYRRSIIGDIRYDEHLIANEDILFCIKVLSKAERLKVIPYIFYNVYVHCDSLTHQTSYYKLQYEAWDVFNDCIYDYFAEKRWFDEHALIVSNDSIKYHVDTLRNINKKYKKSAIDVQNIKRGNRTFARLAKINFYLYAYYSVIYPFFRQAVKKLVVKLSRKFRA